MSYRELPPPARLRGLVECVWTREGRGGPARVLPDGCMDLLLPALADHLDGSSHDPQALGGRVLVAGPDLTAFVTESAPGLAVGVRFHPGALPRLLGVPAAELRGRRVALGDLASTPVHGVLRSPLHGVLRSPLHGVLRSPLHGVLRAPVHGALSAAMRDGACPDGLPTGPLPDGPPGGGPGMAAGTGRWGAADPTDQDPAVLALLRLTASLAAAPPSRETAPWSLATLAALTRRLGDGATVREVGADLGWSERTLHRRCLAVYGYGPATLRRVLRFRRAATLLDAGVPVAEVAARTGYADQPHLSREVRALAGVPASALAPSSVGARSN